MIAQQHSSGSSDRRLPAEEFKFELFEFDETDPIRTRRRDAAINESALPASPSSRDSRWTRQRQRRLRDERREKNRKRQRRPIRPPTSSSYPSARPLPSSVALLATIALLTTTLTMLVTPSPTITIFALASSSSSSSSSGGYLTRPPSRNFLAYVSNTIPHDSPHRPPSSLPEFEPTPQSLDIGPTCGAADGREREYDSPMSRAQTIMPLNVVGIYQSGGEVDVRIDLFDAEGGGHFEFDACPLEYPRRPTEECFGRHPLEFVRDEHYGAVRDERYPNRAYLPHDGAFREGSLLRRVESPYPGPGGATMMEFSYVFRLPEDEELNTELSELAERGVPNGNVEGTTFTTHQGGGVPGTASVDDRGRGLQTVVDSGGGQHHKRNNQRKKKKQWIATQSNEVVVPSLIETVLISVLSTDGKGTTTIITLDGDVTTIEGGPEIEASSTLTYGSKDIYGDGIDLGSLPKEALELAALNGAETAEEAKGDDVEDPSDSLGAETEEPADGAAAAEGGNPGGDDSNSIINLNIIPFDPSDSSGAETQTPSDGAAEDENPGFEDSNSSNNGGPSDPSDAEAATPLSSPSSSSSVALSPDDPNPKYVLLRWRYVTARDCHPPGYDEYPWPSRWGTRTPQWGGECRNDGNGSQERYWNCAEVLVLGPEREVEDRPDAEDELIVEGTPVDVIIPQTEPVVEEDEEGAVVVVAVDDVVVTESDVPARVDVAANDVYASPATTTGVVDVDVSIARDARHGACRALDPSAAADVTTTATKMTREVLYVPDPGYQGWDRCLYRACLLGGGEDGEDVCDEARIKIKVLPGSEEPTAMQEGVEEEEEEPSQSAAAEFEVALRPVPERPASAPVVEPDDSVAEEVPEVFPEDEEAPIEYEVEDLDPNAVGLDPEPVDEEEPDDAAAEEEVLEVFAEDDEATTTDSAPVTVDVAANDRSSSSNATLEVRDVNRAKHGLCEVTRKGRVRYTPAPGFVGRDRCPYMVCALLSAEDGGGGGGGEQEACDKGRLSVEVLPSPSNSERPTVEEDAAPVNSVRPQRPEAQSQEVETIDLALQISNALEEAKGQADNPGEGEAETIDLALQITPNDEPDKGDEQELEMVYAEDETVITPVNTPVSVDVASNDFVKGMDPLVVTRTDGAANGTCELTEDGRVRYTPRKRFEGLDHCAYEVCHVVGSAGELGMCDEGILEIEVTPPRKVAKKEQAAMASQGGNGGGLVSHHESSGGLSLGSAIAAAMRCRDGDGGGRNLLRGGSGRALPENARCEGSSLVSTGGDGAAITYTSTYRERNARSAAAPSSVLPIPRMSAVRTGRSASGGLGGEVTMESYLETVITVPASGDAVIMPGYPDTCFGNTPSVIVSSAESDAGLHETLLQFQTSAVDTSVCGGRAAVASAAVHLYSLANSFQNGIFVTTSDSTWEEGNVTWNTAPPSDGIVLTAPNGGGGGGRDRSPLVRANRWRGVDVASALVWGETLSIRILAEEGERDVARYASGQYADGTLAPILNVTCVLTSDAFSRDGAAEDSAPVIEGRRSEPPNPVAPWEVHYLGFAADSSIGSVRELTLDFEIGLGRAHETEIFASDCSSPIAGMILLSTADGTLVDQHFELLRLKYDVDVSSVDGSDAWNAHSGRLEFCQVVRLVSPGENDSAPALVVKEDKQVLSIDLNHSKGSGLVVDAKSDEEYPNPGVPPR